MDAFSDVLGQLRLTDASWACVSATAPWGVRLEPMPGGFRFVFVASGSCVLSLEDSREPPIALSSGDLAVMPHGHGFVVRDQPRSRASNFEELRRRATRSARCATHHVQVGRGGTEANVVHGVFRLADAIETPLLATLPPLFRIRPDAEDALPSFRQNLQLISRELDANRPGSRTVLTRMADVILVQILRAYMESLPAGSTGVLGALRDKSLAAALGLMHQQPEEAWTVARLADRVGLSRSSFAARFMELVGEPPLGYLTRLRMQRASTLLREGATLAKASQLTGYASEASFSHAFRQWAGVPPGAYRRGAG